MERYNYNKKHIYLSTHHHHHRLHCLFCQPLLKLLLSMGLSFISDMACSLKDDSSSIMAVKLIGILNN